MEFGEEVVAAIESVTREPEVRANRDLPLFELQVLDSLRTVMLVVELNSRFGVDIALSEVDRDAWATPARIVDFVAERVQTTGPAELRPEARSAAGRSGHR
jgi:D-alanine--poly(phosphoribitol) ligase subunit 2